MFIKNVTIIGKEDTKKFSKSGYCFTRYYCTAPIGESYGIGHSTYSFTSTHDFQVGDEVQIAYLMKKTSDGVTFSTWEVLTT